MAHTDPMMAPLPRGYGQHVEQDDSHDHDGQTASIQSSSSVSLQTLSLLDSLDEALDSLESEVEHDRAVAAKQLSKLVEGVYGEDAAAVGNYVRESGALETLLELVLALYTCTALSTSNNNAPRKQPTACPCPCGPARTPQCPTDAVCRLRTRLLMSTRRC